ncbi:hypothetical protein PVAP13_1NG193957 [Panicum virgatum]|uniref:Uncharacterized protein n=1 Tax=Panicum virgatum TaxID=38727 RepID=A0A8T0WZ58_PANVG|nr:hypothetical protein PVAP13_1NG193957 [Panicum virgatum]
MLTFPNFNFNTSHQGDYVGIASEPLCLVGLDIISVFKPQGKPPPSSSVTSLHTSLTMSGTALFALVLPMQC